MKPALPLTLTLYRAATAGFAPLAGLFLARRERRGKEDAARRSERLGIAGRPRPAGPLCWLHGASVGEAVTILPIAERLVQKVAETPMVVEGAPNKELTVTVSVGVASTNVEMPGDELIKLADAALYRAKETGRNRAIADPASLL